MGETLDVDVALTDIPVGLANGFVPDLDATGTISGTASATGGRVTGRFTVPQRRN